MTLAPPSTETQAGRPEPQVAQFRAFCERLAGTALPDPQALHRWSVEHPATFWRALLTWSEVPWSGSANTVLVGSGVETARFFPDLRLNYAEALLRPLPGVDDDGPALTSVHADRPAERWSRAQLRDEVRRVSAALAGTGLCAGDRVVLVAPNTGRTAVAALAATALGASVATAMPDMGAGALVGRFEQVEPVLLALDRTGMADGTLSRLLQGLPTLRRLVILDELPLPTVALPVDRLDELPVTAADSPAWERRAFDTPLFVLFSSGTTGAPKAMVHGTGGTLLEHVKEHRLHNDMRPGDVYFHRSTTAWMVWNRHLSALASGVHVVLYDGPIAGPETLWELVADHGVTVFGTSPAYLQLCEDAGYRPADSVDLCRLRAVLSQGSVLEDWQYDWVADAVGPVSLWSSSGGTDIIGSFVLSSPELPVRRGRIQVRSLGMDVAALDDQGQEVIGQVGELVCRNPFPSRPVGFLRDRDGRRFHEAYFAQNPGMWTHGDRIDFDPDGSARVHGRSDGVLNIDGVRIGPSEIYTVLRRLPDITDAAAVEQRHPDRPGSARMVLLVTLRPGARLDGGLERTIRRTLRQEASAAHVPSLVLAVPELPYTHNGKRSERAVRDAVNGDPVPNSDALRNPGSLDAIRAAVHGALTRPGSTEPPVEPAIRTPADGRLLGEVSRIWADVLGRSDVEPDDDFSDVGGSSRQALSLLRLLRLELGADVPLQEFAQRPTPRGLADAAAAARTRVAAGATVLRPGSGRPVFLLPDAWGQLNLYAGLVRRLDTHRPVIGLQFSLTDAEGRRRSIPELAAEGLDQVRALQPEGPYRLIGYSFGGLVAYEMAVQLRTAGEAVPYLGLLDVRTPTAALRPRELARRRRAYRLRTITSGALVPALARRLGLRSVERELRGKPDPEAEFFRGSQAVAETYRPGSFEGAVSYYLAEGTTARGRREALASWRRVVRHLLVTEVPGHHGDIDDERIGMLSEQHVAVLAALVTAALG